VLVKPATVVHWRRKGFENAGPPVAPAARKTSHRCRHSRPHWAHGEGKPSPGSSPDPRGVAEAGNHRPEHTVSRYLPDRVTRPSQTWRTFLVNHFGDLTFISSLPSSGARLDDVVVDTCVRPLRSTPTSGDALCARDQWAVIAWHPSVPRARFGWQNARAELRRRAFTSPSSSRDPPSREPTRLALTRMHGRSFARILQTGARPTGSLRRFLTTRTEIATGNSGLVACDQVVNVVGNPKRLGSVTAKAASASDSHGRREYWRGTTLFGAAGGHLGQPEPNSIGEFIDLRQPLPARINARLSPVCPRIIR